LILQAADELFGELGLEGVSVRDVALRAGVNKALVFYYFASKEKLFEAVLERYYQAHRAALESSFKSDAPLSQKLHSLVDAYLDFIEQHRRYPSLVQSLVVGSPAFHPFIQRNLEPMFRFTEAALAGLSPEHGPLAARHFFLDISAAVINTFTYAPVLAPMWGGDPLAPAALAERRKHLHWLADALIAGLTQQAR
jgi:AcrR family transcriptional regulator